MILHQRPSPSRRPLATVPVLLALVVAPRTAPAGAAGNQTGPNDFRISEMGLDGVPFQTGIQAQQAAVAYNATDDEYLVVWSGRDSAVFGTEIWGQILDAETGFVVKNDFRISRVGADGDLFRGAFDPDVAWDSDRNRYLVVWTADDQSNDESEIFGQIVDADGSEVGFDDFRISQMGPDGDADFDAFFPAVAFNSDDDEFLVVWEGDHDLDPDDFFADPLVDDEFEIFGQRIDAAFPVVFAFDPVRISDMGGSGNVSWFARGPDVAYNGVDNEYLVCWYGRDFENLTEIFVQRLRGADASEVGTNDIQISDLDLLFAGNFDALDPAIAHNPLDDEYLVVWSGDRSEDGLADDESEIWGQRLDPTGMDVGPNDFLISDIGGYGDPDRDAFDPAVAFSPRNREYLVAFRGDDNFLVDDEFEIYVQYLDARSGRPTGINDERISGMGSAIVDNLYDAFLPAVAANSSSGEWLVVWHGDDNEGELVDDEYEIFGQRMLPLGEIFVDGFESGDGCRWAPSEWFVCGP